MNKEEIWKAIEGYEDYEISSLGRVKSLANDKSRKEKILKPMKHRDGYLFVHLYRDRKYKRFYVHRLVATAFIPNPEGFEQINHKDENKINNVVDNIEWVSRSYNINFGTRNIRAATTLTNHPALSKAVEASRFSDFRTIEFRFVSTQEAGRNGYEQSAVSACCNGCYCRKGNNKYKKLYWRFAS